MARQPASFARSQPRFKPQPRVLVLCEDRKSSLIYLKEAVQHFRAHAVVEVVHCGKNDPKGIVAEAVRRQRAYDRVYCAIDRDSDAKFDQALSQAVAHPKIDVVVSYPCYEFWLLLHFRQSRKPYSQSGKFSAAACAVKELCAEDGMAGYDKGDTNGLFHKLLGRLPEARRRAVEVLQAALSEGEMNPSTRLHELMAAFESLGSPQPL